MSLRCATNSSTRAVSPLICRSSPGTSGFSSSAGKSIFSGGMKRLAWKISTHYIRAEG
jgi:hypothetical protein